ncbi:MAG: serine/threonine protein kinase [Lentisphaeraceae bacterium]|nr:serine/threonine protein kinase [Lentisphaeraceae bacterium]
MSIFKSIMNFGHKPEDYTGRLEKYEHLLYPCKKCHEDVDISQCYALTMQHCPNCDELFLVPMRIEDWWVCQPLGGGGMGAVYLGRHAQNPELRAAVKVLQQSDEVNQMFLEMLIHEAQIASKFGKHPLLAEVYAFGYDDNEAYMIMEFVEGVRFDKLIDDTQGKGINEELAMYYLLDMLSGLEYMFQCGYLYRDLKPENIIVKNDGYVTLVDYGLCMTINEGWYNESEDIMGSPLYMPPERIKGEGEDFRADLYALGMVIFHAMNGAPYFSQTELMKIVQRQWGGLRVQTKFKLPGGNSEVINLVDRLIKVDRDERFQSYHDIRFEVHGILLKLHKSKQACKKTLKRRELYIRDCLKQTQM